jgi:chromosome segregation ATPase
MAQQEMSYAQALNEAKQIIIQQSTRIKADYEKVKNQQQTIVDQAARITDHESRLADLSADLERGAGELRSLQTRYAEAEAGRQQAEAVVNRQGERINHFEAQVEDLSRRLEAQADEIANLRLERDEVRAQLPTSDDVEALSGMMSLLSQKRGGGSAAGSAEKYSAMRIVSEAA